jgi:hypothetical protein
MHVSPYVHHINWGSFTKEFERRKPEYRRYSDLPSFADFILSHPDKFSTKTERRARFYVNLIEHHKTHGGSVSVQDFKDFIINSYKYDKKEVGEFELQPSLSNHEVQTYISREKMQMVIVFRGTKGALDWLNNAQYVLGNYKKTRRFKLAEHIFQEALHEYPDYKVTLIGHSQGGIPEHILNDGKVHEALFLNPAWTTEKQKNNEFIIKSSGDPVSLLVPKHHNNIVIPAKTSNPLHEHSTEILDELPQNKIIGSGIDFKKMKKAELIKFILRHKLY